MIEFITGTPVYGRIRGIELTGTIHTVPSGRMWFCHDHPSFDGSLSPDRHGHPYSWVFERNFERNGRGGFTCDVEYVMPMGEYRKMEVETELSGFISHVCGTHIIGMMNAKLKPFADFTKIEFGKDPGTVRLSGDVTTKKGTFPKSTEIRISRFLRKLHDAYAEFVSSAVLDKITHYKAPTIGDAQLEAIYNKCVAIQSGQLFHLNILRGDDIKHGYTRDHYSPAEKGTLRKSCMTDKLDWLGLYTENQQVSLATLESSAGIEARCLLWESEGRRFYDRIYYTDEWMSNILEKRVRELSYARVDPYEVTTIRLDKAKFRKYPYVDTFFYLDKEESTVSFSESHRDLARGDYRVLRNVDGTYGELSL